MAFSLDALAEKYPIDVVWRSFELRPVGSPPISEAYRQRILEARPRFEAAMREEVGVTIKTGPFGINSRPALIGAKVAEEIGAGEAYHDRVFKAYWQDGRDISDVAVLVEIAEQSGIDAETFKERLDRESYKEEVLAEIDQAHEFGISAVPAMVFARKYLVVGAQPTPVLGNAIEKVIELEKQAAG